VLDVGTGTGVAALEAQRSAGPKATVAGVDPSLEMLRFAREHGVLTMAVGRVPGLPFADGTFNRVLASFVLTHCPSYRDAIADMVRVLRPQGKLGVTAWGQPDEVRERWQALAESFVPKADLDAAVEQALPWEDWFRNAANLQLALREAGLVDVAVHSRAYKTRIRIADFLTMRCTSTQGRFMRQALGDAGWKQCEQAIADAFYREFPDPLDHRSEAHVAMGAKPDAHPGVESG